LIKDKEFLNLMVKVMIFLRKKEILMYNFEEKYCVFDSKNDNYYVVI
jgi:hypothetical protein